MPERSGDGRRPDRTAPPAAPPIGRGAPWAGGLLALMMAATIAAGIIPALPGWPAGLCGWLSALLLGGRISRGQRLQIGVLLGAGITALAIGVVLGGHPPWPRLLDANTGLLSMLAAVSFLRLVALKNDTGSLPAPRGRAAFRHTMLSVALFGGFINISAPILIADRISHRRNLSPFAAQSITRVFTGAAAWSPFFAGMAVVLTYIGDARLLFVMLVGLPFALLGLGLVLLEAHLRYGRELDDFEGYPMNFASLWVPLCLAIAVCLGRTGAPRVPILIVIALAALTVSGLVLLARRGAAAAWKEVCTHIRHGLPGMAGELLLFLAAGVLAVGLQTFVAAAHINLPLAGGFDATVAGALLVGLVVTSALGVHPIIAIAVFTPLLQPSRPDPHLLAITYVLAWSLGTCASPLSGINLIIQGRYGISSARGAMRNWPFVLVMTLFGLAFLQAAAFVRGI